MILYSYRFRGAEPRVASPGLSRGRGGLARSYEHNCVSSLAASQRTAASHLCRVVTKVTATVITLTWRLGWKAKSKDPAGRSPYAGPVLGPLLFTFYGRSF